MHNYPVIVVGPNNERITCYSRKQLRKHTRKYTVRTRVITETEEGKKKTSVTTTKQYEILSPRKIMVPKIDVQGKARKYPVTLSIRGAREGAILRNHKAFHYAKRRALKEMRPFQVTDADNIVIFSNL